MFSIRMALECNGQVFNLSLNRIENGVLYFHLEDVGVQMQRERQRSGMGEVAGGQPEETQALSPGAEEGGEALQPPEARASTAAEPPGGPEGEGVEPAPPSRRKAARPKRQR